MRDPARRCPCNAGRAAAANVCGRRRSRLRDVTDLKGAYSIHLSDLHRETSASSRGPPYIYLRRCQVGAACARAVQGRLAQIPGALEQAGSGEARAAATNPRPGGPSSPRLCGVPAKLIRPAQASGLSAKKRCIQSAVPQRKSFWQVPPTRGVSHYAPTQSFAMQAATPSLLAAVESAIRSANVKLLSARHTDRSTAQCTANGRQAPCGCRRDSGDGDSSPGNCGSVRILFRDSIAPPVEFCCRPGCAFGSTNSEG
jgi:hypothetical protein